VKKGTEVTVDEIMMNYNKNRSFYKKGGLTVTGGEPLLQIDFLLELFQEAKRQKIHTCIDTSGITYRPGNAAYNAKLDELMKYTDLVLLDVKHIDSEKHKALTGHGNEKILSFAKYIDKKGIPIWARHVVVEGYTDQEDEHYRLGLFLGTLKSLKALDVLAYHTMGVKKYEELGIPYPLDGVKPTSQEKKNAARAKILEGIRDARKNK
jgi:pyruvate formate lyase activating enzyme